MCPANASTVAGMLSWKSEDRFDLGGVRFRTMPSTDLLDGEDLDLADGEFFIFKPVQEVESYAELVRAHKPKRILELGVYGGGSTVFLAAVARPERLVALDIQPLDELQAKLGGAVAAAGLDGDAIRLHGEIDQSNAAALARIHAEDFGGELLDLVIDDASHVYLPSVASFDMLFPRVRPGGLYVVEDWRWAHEQFDAMLVDGTAPDRVPMTRLLLEALAVFGQASGLIASMTIQPDKAIVERGEAPCPEGFSLSAMANPGGRALQGAGEARRRRLFG